VLRKDRMKCCNHPAGVASAALGMAGRRRLNVIVLFQVKDEETALKLRGHI
jgi:hypothetical protein